MSLVRTKELRKYAFFLVERYTTSIITEASQHKNLLDMRLFNSLQFTKGVKLFYDSIGPFLMYKNQMVGRQWSREFKLHDVVYCIYESHELEKLFDVIECVDNLQYLK